MQNQQATKSIQLRGICQCCGREQAVVKGRIAKHGYVVENGWFQGVCSGHNYQPMQLDVTATNVIIAQVNADIVKLQETLVSYTNGVKTPSSVTRRKYDATIRDYISVTTNWADLSAYDQDHELKAAIYYLQNRINSGNSFISTMNRLINDYHGQPLREVVKGEGPTKIALGESRKRRGVVMTVVEIRSHYVYATIGDRANAKAKISTKEWRTLELA